MSAEERHMNSQCDSYKKAESDHNRLSFESWKERLMRFEDIISRSQARDDHHAEAVKKFIELSHENPKWHQDYMFKELEWETFCLVNKLPYEPSVRDGVPGYWDYRKRKAESWILLTRKRFPNE